MHLPVGTRPLAALDPDHPRARANWKRENRLYEWLQPLHRPGSGRLPVKSWTQFNARRLRQSGPKWGAHSGMSAHASALSGRVLSIVRRPNCQTSGDRPAVCGLRKQPWGCMFSPMPASSIHRAGTSVERNVAGLHPWNELRGRGSDSTTAPVFVQAQQLGPELHINNLVGMAGERR